MFVVAALWERKLSVVIVSSEPWRLLLQCHPRLSLSAIQCSACTMWMGALGSYFHYFIKPNLAECDLCSIHIFYEVISD